MKSVIVAAVAALMLSTTAASATSGPWNQLWPELFKDTSGKSNVQDWKPADVCDRAKEWAKCAFEPKGDENEGGTGGGAEGDGDTSP